MRNRRAHLTPKKASPTTAATVPGSVSKTPEYKPKGFNVANSRPTPPSGEDQPQEPARRKRDGALLVIPGVDFITTTEKYGPFNYFDVPGQEYSRGNREGLMCAWQLMRSIANSPDSLENDAQGYITDVYAAAISARDEDGDLTYSRRGAGVGFTYAMSSLLAAIAKTDLWQPILEQQLREEEEAAVRALQDALKEADDFRSTVQLPRRFDGSEGDADGINVTVKPRTPKPSPRNTKSATA